MVAIAGPDFALSNMSPSVAPGMHPQKSKANGNVATGAVDSSDKLESRKNRFAGVASNKAKSDENGEDYEAMRQSALASLPGFIGGGTNKAAEAVVGSRSPWLAAATEAAGPGSRAPRSTTPSTSRAGEHREITLPHSDVLYWTWYA